MIGFNWEHFSKIKHELYFQVLTVKSTKFCSITQVLMTVFFIHVIFQSIYFHTSIVSSNIVAVVELVASGLDAGGRLKKVSCGWGIIRPFKGEEIPDTARNVKLPIQK